MAGQPVEEPVVPKRSEEYTKRAKKELAHWEKVNSARFNKAKELVEEILEDPRKGRGGPHQLGGAHRGYWARELSKGDRIVYEFDDEKVRFHRFKGHYGDMPGGGKAMLSGMMEEWVLRG